MILLQVAAKAINAGGSYTDKQMGGVLVGCDLLYMQPVEGVSFLQSDFTSESTQKEILKVLNFTKIIYLGDFTKKLARFTEMGLF